MSITAVAETGSSWFLFAHDEVVKILKPLRRGPVDLSTVAARQKQLKDEMELLNWFNPGLAQRVVPLKTGETVSEVALLMRRIPRGTNLLARLLTMRVESGDLRRLGQGLAKLHQKQAAPAKHVAKDHRALREELDQAIQPLLESTASMFLSHDAAMRLRDGLHGLLDRHASAVQDRIRHRKIRRVHGNLQAGNVYLEERGASLLDPSRENGGAVYDDGLSDLGGVVKDVRVFLPDEADALVRAYLGKVPNEAESQLLLFYELLWTVRRFVAHTAELAIGNGGPIDMELVQRYRQRIMRAVTQMSQRPHVQKSERRPAAPKKARKAVASAKPSPKQQPKKRRTQPAAPVKAAKKPAPKKKPPMKKPAAKKTLPKKPAPRKPVKKAPAKKKLAPKRPTPRKPTPKKAPAKKKAAPKKPAPKKPAPKKNKKKSARGGHTIGDTLKGFLGLKQRRR